MSISAYSRILLSDKVCFLKVYFIKGVDRKNALGITACLNFFHEGNSAFLVWLDTLNNISKFSKLQQIFREMAFSFYFLNLATLPTFFPLRWY